MQIRLRFVRQKYTEICLTRSMLAQSQLSKSELFDIANQPTNGSPLKKKKKKIRKKRASKLPRANGNRLNGQKSLGDPGIWHLHLANENLTRFAGKLLLQYARSLPMDSVLQSDTCHPPPPARRLRSSIPFLHSLFVPVYTQPSCPATFDIGYIFAGTTDPRHFRSRLRRREPRGPSLLPINRGIPA